MVEHIFDIDTYSIPEEGQVSIQGNPNTARIVILLREVDYETHGDLLNNILNAIKIDVQQDAVILKLASEASCHLHKHITAATEYVLSFGLGIKSLGVNASFMANHFYQTESYAIMLTHGLEKLNADKQKKKALWQALQSVFIKA
jgi:DNA polymerase III psi subunit